MLATLLIAFTFRRLHYRHYWTLAMAFYRQHMLHGQQEYLQAYATGYNGLMVVNGMIASVKELAGITFWFAMAVLVFLLACNWDWLFGKRSSQPVS